MLRIPEYESLRESAGIVDRSDRGVVRLDGADRRSFLQGLLTNDIQALAPGGACYAALLTPQGRMIADMHVFETGDYLLLDVRRNLAAPLTNRLDQSIFTEDVRVRDASAEFGRVAVAGPDAQRVLEQALAADPRVSTRHFSDPAYDVPVFEVFADAEAFERLVESLQAAGAHHVGPEAWDAYRIESGVPLFGVDMDEDTIPLEAGIQDRAISFTKGCYVGQEVIVRVMHRGHGRVAKRLVQFEIDAGSEDDLPPRGTGIAKEGERAGSLTSVAWSPRAHRGIALGYLRREIAEGGTEDKLFTTEPTETTERSLGKEKQTFLRVLRVLRGDRSSPSSP